MHDVKAICNIHKIFCQKIWRRDQQNEASPGRYATHARVHADVIEC